MPSASKVNTSSKLPPLMRAGKELSYDGVESDYQKALLGTNKKKTKKEELIDKKIEYLLETYKKQDEEIIKKAHGHQANKEMNKKLLRDKFGFDDDESQQDDNELNKVTNEKKSTVKALPSYSAQAQHVTSTMSQL